MAWDCNGRSAAPVQARIPLDLTEEETAIYEILQQKGETGIDALTHSIGWDPGWLASWLISLECKGIIRVLPGKRYVIL
jgi:DNA processing protein